MKYIFHMITALYLFGCSQAANINLDEGKPQVVLNSILDATKDTIWAELSWSKPITSNFELEAIDNATILLSANNEIVDTFSHFNKDRYFLNFTPCAADEYKITAIVENDTIWGTTRIPPLPKVTIEALGTYCRYYIAHIETNTDENFTYWISASLLTYKKDILIRREFINGLKANQILLDDFNRTADAFCSLSFDYSYYLRILNTVEPQFDTIRFATGSGSSNERGEIVVFAADTHYDRFIKSSILGEYVESVTSEMPLYSSLVVNYSNIHGGLGLLGSINSITQVFKYD